MGYIPPHPDDRPDPTGTVLAAIVLFAVGVIGIVGMWVVS